MGPRIGLSNLFKQLNFPIVGVILMCGLAGIAIHKSSSVKGFRGTMVLRRMIERLRHRGPEAVRVEEIQTNGSTKYWLAHSRLRVNDESSVADQPYSSQNQRWDIVYNGEIYNCETLDKILKSYEFLPRTKSDTERLVEIIDKYGCEALNVIDGMFAFGALDKLTGSLFLARDRFGQKPLYYLESQGIFAFASELSALVELSEFVPMQINLISLSQYLNLRYIPAPYTAISPIKKLEPGQYGVLDSNGCFILDRFFSPESYGTLCVNDHDITTGVELRKKPLETLNRLLTTSVRQTVPENAAMIISGGVDSTLISAYTRDLDEINDWDTKKRVGYTVQLEHQPLSEAEWAKYLCKKWNWKHELLTLTDRQLINSYLHLSERLDEPLGDRSLLPSWVLAQAISPHQRVAIGGDGGDELFFGYERYPKVAKKLETLGSEISWTEFYWKYGLSVCDQHALNLANSFIEEEPMGEIYNKYMALQDRWDKDPIVFLQILDLLTYLPGSVLSKVDRSSMDWGLEVRAPFLNSHLALAGLTLRPEQQIIDSEMKYLLKSLLSQKVGPLPRGGKLGFGAAIKKGSELEYFLMDRISSGLSRAKKKTANKVIDFMTTYTKETKIWSQNNLFATAIYLDWLNNMLDTFPQLN